MLIDIACHGHTFEHYLTISQNISILIVFKNKIRSTLIKKKVVERNTCIGEMSSYSNCFFSQVVITLFFQLLFQSFFSFVDIADVADNAWIQNNPPFSSLSVS